LETIIRLTMHTLNSPPPNYAPPKSPLEIRICKLLFGTMFDDRRIYVDYGRGEPAPPEADYVLAPPRLTPAVRLILAPNLWAGESFINGAWYLKKGNLSEFLRLCTHNSKSAFASYYDFTSRIRGVRYYIGQYLLNKYYTRKVKTHYDVDSKIYEMFLDDEMVYTCAFFNRAEDDLAAAQENKLAITIARMELPAGPARVLDIGCGWGAMERALVKSHPDVEVCGLSISTNQLDWARKKDHQALSNSQMTRIEYRLEDYVDHARFEHYDAISVVGMLEHVGLGGYDEFFGRIYKFLKSGGRAIVHTIVCPLSADPTNSWIDRHIFTGGYAPSVSEVTRAAERQSLHIAGMHVHHGWNYRKTIEAWIDNYAANLANVRDYLKSIDLTDAEVEKLVRTWMFYLSGVRNMFIEDGRPSHQIVQFAFRKV
jgi:cyclopropane-fatty-acyl-phospholipid synthase